MRGRGKKIAVFRRTYWTVFLVTFFFYIYFFFFLCKRRPFSYIIIYKYYTLVSIYKRPSYTRCVFAVGSRVKNKTRAQFSITRTPIYCVLWWFFYPIFILFNVRKTSLVNDCEKLIGVWYKRERAYTRIDVLEDFYRFFFYVISKNSSRGLAASMRVNGGLLFVFFAQKNIDNSKGVETEEIGKHSCGMIYEYSIIINRGIKLPKQLIYFELPVPPFYIISL